MTGENHLLSGPEIKNLLGRYEDRIGSVYPTAKPVRKSDAIPVVADAERLLWMINEVREILDPAKAVRGQLIRAARWMGYVEGSMVQLGLITVEEVQMLDVERLIHQEVKS